MARHGIEPYPLAFQTSTLPSSSRAKLLVDGARLELAFHAGRPWAILLYEPPIWGEMRESNSRNWSHNPAPKPFGQSRHRIWSCWLDSHQHQPAYKAGAFVGRPQQQTLELARSLELRSGAYHAPALPVELYQRSWRGDSNAHHGLTRPALFPLRYTSTSASNIWRRWGELHSRLSALQADALLSWRHRLTVWSGRRDSNPRSRRWQRRVLAARRLPPGASSASRTHVISLEG